MNIKETHMEAVRIEWPCSIAGCDGFMEATGIGNQHVCTKCRYALYPDGDEIFPRLIFRPIEGRDLGHA